MCLSFQKEPLEFHEWKHSKEKQNSVIEGAVFSQ